MAGPYQANPLTVDPRFQRTFRVLSSLYMGNPDQRPVLESGGKVILPQDALEQLSNSDPEILQRPIQYRVINAMLVPAKITHCGVLEFTAPTDAVYMPGWMMNHLVVADHSMLTFDLAVLPKATFCRFQPQCCKFLEITNPKAMLENTLRQFACLTRGDTLTIQYNNHEYKLLVQELQPSEAVSIIDCDMETEFADPVDYQPPPPKKPANDKKEDKPKKKVTTAFIGLGYRLNRKTPIKAKEPSTGAKDGADADVTWKIGDLKFKR